MPYHNERTSKQPLTVSKRSTTDDFHQLVQDLSTVLGPTSGINSADVDPQDLIDIMERYVSDERHWYPYAFADPVRNYTRNLVDEGNGKSNLLVVVWNPAKGSPIHDHANAHCVMKVLKGTLEETLYTLPSPISTDESIASGLQINDLGCTMTTPIPTRSTTYHTNQVTYISDKIGLHKIRNPSSEVAVSLHLYTPPHAANYGFNLFDEKTGKQTHIIQAGFFSNRGKRERVGLNGSL